MMRAEGIAITIGHNTKPLGPADPVLHPDTKATEAAVVILFLIGQFPLLRLLVGEVDIRMLLVVALIRAVAIDTGPLWQRRPGAADRQIVLAAGMGR